jgi:hypothetical protein
MRRWTMTMFVIAAFAVAGCAGPAKLAEKSEDKLAQGDVWKAWQLATRALDKAPANPRARQAAAAAASSIAQDWERRIVALAQTDSLAAAEEVLKFAQFRTDAIPYTTVAVGDGWLERETAIRTCAARTHYAEGSTAWKANRPKKAYGEFLEATRFVPGYRDAGTRADAAFAKGLTRVAVLPLRTGPGNEGMGREVAQAWSGSLVEHMPTDEAFTRMMASDDVERFMRISEMGKSSRADAIRIGAKAGADRVVYGQIGDIDSKTGVQFFRRNIWHRVSGKDASGTVVTRWIAEPVEMIARTRTVQVDMNYEVIATDGGVTLTRQSCPRTIQARAVWTAWIPDGDADSYTLVTEESRGSNPEGAKAIETEWSSVMGAGVTLAQVIDARRACMRKPYDRTAAITRFAAGAAFVMLQELPSARELAQATAENGWQSVRESLVRLDGVDDAEIRATAVSSTDE